MDDGYEMDDAEGGPFLKGLVYKGGHYRREGCIQFNGRRMVMLQRWPL